MLRLKKKKDQDGFSLAELMVSTLFLAIVITGIIRLLVHCTVLSEESSNKTIAINEGQSKLDEIRIYEYDDIVTNYNGSAFNLTLPKDATGAVTVTQIGADVAADLLQVDVAISWNSKQNRSMSTSVTGLISRR